MIMGITIEEAIKQLTTYSIPCGKYKNAYDMAVDTMRKCQKIEDIVRDYYNEQYTDKLDIEIID